MIKRQLRQIANVWLARRGLEIVHRRIENDPSRQLWLALRHHNIQLILDVGANAGQYGEELFRAGYDGEIHSLEPQPDAHARLCECARQWKRWTVLDAVAAGDCEGSVEMTVAGNSVSSSVLPMLDRHVRAAPGSAPVGRVTVRQTTLDSLFAERLDADQPALLKIDVQGYEPRVLAGAAHCLSKARLVQLELSLQPLYAGQQLWLELIETMRRHGYQPWSIHPEFCDPRTGQVLQVNGLFARS
jgi:FkbM family methyltransferase